MNKFLIVIPSRSGPELHRFNDLDSMAAFLMLAFRDFDWMHKTATAWKLVRRQWVPCWRWQNNEGCEKEYSELYAAQLEGGK